MRRGIVALVFRCRLVGAGVEPSDEVQAVEWSTRSRATASTGGSRSGSAATSGATSRTSGSATTCTAASGSTSWTATAVRRRGPVPLPEPASRAVRRVVEGRLGPASVNRTVIVLAGVLDEAVEYGHLAADPAKSKRR